LIFQLPASFHKLRLLGSTPPDKIVRPPIFLLKKGGNTLPSINVIFQGLYLTL
jgi:hypothetical protein